MKLLLFLYICAIGTGCYGKTQIESDFEGKQIPIFRLLQLDSTTKVNTPLIVPGRSTVLFYFTTNCPYCRAMTQELIDKMNMVQDVQFYLVSNTSLRDLHQFVSHFRLDQYSNIIVLQDQDGEIIRHFGIVGVPYVVVIENGGKIKKVIDGKTTIDQLKNIIVQKQI